MRVVLLRPCALALLLAAATQVLAEEPLERRIPGQAPDVPPTLPTDPNALRPAPANLPFESVPVPDRWRIVESIGVNEHWYDPYNQSTLKGDRPVFGDDWFVNLSLISDTIFEPRRLPTPVGLQTTSRSSTLDVFGRDEQLIAAENLIGSFSLIQGNTVFQPPDWEFRLTSVVNYNYLRAQEDGLVNVDPQEQNTRGDKHLAVQELFVDRHLWNKSERYDFDSLRVGIQPFISDFRGFVFQDNPFAVRLFGTFASNRLQYNLAWLRRIEKDTNSGLNRVFDSRRDNTYVANLYVQDFPVHGFTTQGTVLHNLNHEGQEKFHFNENGFLERPASIGDERPHDYRVTYLGLNGDGHFGWLNLTTSVYHALGTDDRNPIARREVDIRSWLLAAEASVDFDWYRLKVFGFYGSGDDDPFDSVAAGFDAIFENPNFAGASTSFFQRQNIPFIGGGGVALSGRDALLISLRSSKEEGQSNFVNPGIRLVGIGGDFDVLPQLRLLWNSSLLYFDETEVLSVLRNQGHIDHSLGTDLSMGLIYRPLFTENIVLQLSGAILLPGEGLDQIYDTSSNRSPFYSVLANVILRY